MSYLRNPAFNEKDFPAFAIMREQIGFLPNFYVAQTTRPDLIETEVALMGAILLKDGALSRKQKEYIFLVTSAANLSTYCVTAHCEIVRMLKLEGPEPEQIAIDHVHAKIPMAEKALLNFCAKHNKQPSKTGPAEIETLRTYGFTEQQIMEAIVIVGFSQFANTVAFGLGTVPDFHNAKINAALGQGESAAQTTQ
jgi:uncharacterized peroxidase-related enzyme